MFLNDILHQDELLAYCKIPKNMETQKFAVITLKVKQGGFTLE